MNTWFEIKALAKNSRRWTINIYGVIGEGGITAAKFAEELAKVPADAEITLCISSKGGSVYDGLSIYEQISAIRERVVARVEGLAASMASVVMLAAREITASENSMIMVHNPVIAAAGNADDLRASADILDKIGGQLISVYERKTGKSRADLEAVLSGADGRGTWMTAAEAKAFGLVDRLFGALQVAAVAQDECGAVVDIQRFAEQKREQGEGSTAPTGAGIDPETPDTPPEPTPAERIASLEADLAAAQVRVGQLVDESARYLAQANSAAELLAAAHQELEHTRAQLADQQAARAAIEAEAASLRARVAEREQAGAQASAVEALTIEDSGEMFTYRAADVLSMRRSVATIAAVRDTALARVAELEQAGAQAVTAATETAAQACADLTSLRAEAVEAKASFDRICEISAQLQVDRDRLLAELAARDAAALQARGEAAVDAAIASGRLRREAREAWLGRYAADEVGAKALLESLRPASATVRGVAPVFNMPDTAPAGDRGSAVVAQWRAMPPGAERQKFFATHESTIWAATRGCLVAE